MTTCSSACKVQYVESAHEIITFELAQGFRDNWKLGSLRSTSYKAFCGASSGFSPFGLTAGGGLSGFYEELKFTDPEGYCNIFRWVYGGLSAEEKMTFGAALPGIAGAEAFKSGNVTVQGIYGKFWEPKTPQAFAVGQFKTLIQEKEHSNNPTITSHFSRARLLDKKLSAQLNSELEETLNEVAEIEQLRLDFNAIKTGMDYRLSIYMSPFPELTDFYSAVTAMEFNEEFPEQLASFYKKPTFASSLLKAPPNDITEATITGAVGKLSVGVEGKYSVGTESKTKGSNCAGGDLAVYGSGKAIVRLRDEVKRTPTGFRFVDGTKSEQEKVSIRQQVAQRFDGFKNTIIQCAQHEPASLKLAFTEPGFDV